MSADNIRIIKRYPNRKLYDTLTSKYITMDKVSDLIKNGEDVKIIEHNSGEDLTENTLLQIIRFKSKNQSIFSVKALMELIRSGTSVSNDFISGIKNEVDNKVHEIPGINEIKSVIDNYHSHFLEWQNKVDSQIKSLIDNYTGIFSREVSGLQNRITKLETLVQELKNKLEEKNKKN